MTVISFIFLMEGRGNNFPILHIHNTRTSLFSFTASQQTMSITTTTSLQLLLFSSFGQNYFDDLILLFLKK